MNRQRGQSALEFALMSPLILLIIFGAIYGGGMFIQFMNYSNEARTIAREIAVASKVVATGETKSPREKLVESHNGVGVDSEGETLGGMYKVTLITTLLKDGVATTNNDPEAKEVGVRFEFDHGHDFPFGFPPRTFAASYRMQLEDN